jgi:hypothetical protein
MFWRLLTVSILLFWAVMTGLVIRDSYFPDHSRFAEVPVRMVFDLFLTEAAAFNNTLDLYHDKVKIGHTTFTIRKIGDDDNSPLYALMVNGTVQMPTETESVNATFNLTGELADAERWRRFKLDFKAPAAETSAMIAWKLGDELPDLEVKKSGKLVMDTEMAKAMMGMKDSLGSGSEWLLQMIPAGALPEASAFQLKAREGQMELAGKKRRCYIVQLALMPGYELKMYFSELGELARVELPQGYRLIEPMMHGLEPGLQSLK